MSLCRVFEDIPSRHTGHRKQKEIGGSSCRGSSHPRLVLDKRLDEGDLSSLPGFKGLLHWLSQSFSPCRERVLYLGDRTMTSWRQPQAVEVASYRRMLNPFDTAFKQVILLIYYLSSCRRIHVDLPTSVTSTRIVPVVRSKCHDKSYPLSLPYMR